MISAADHKQHAIRENRGGVAGSRQQSKILKGLETLADRIERFRAIEGQSGTTRISVGNISAVGPSGENVVLSAPVPVEISINP